MKPLLREEVPRELEGYVDWESQRRGPDGKSQINVECPGCGWVRPRNVSRIRLDSKRRTFTANCVVCSGKEKAPDYTGRTGPEHPSWKGGKWVRNGYVYLHLCHFAASARPLLSGMVLGGREAVAEHRARVAIAMGRPLRENEYVHHLNGKRADNRLENLQLVDHHKRSICPKCAHDSPTMTECVACMK